MSAGLSNRESEVMLALRAFPGEFLKSGKFYCRLGFQRVSHRVVIVLQERKLIELRATHEESRHYQLSQAGRGLIRDHWGM